MIIRQDILILNAEYGDGTTEGVNLLTQAASTIPSTIQKDTAIKILKEVARKL